MNKTVCFIPSADTTCSVGASCSFTENTYNSMCSFNGAADLFLGGLFSVLTKTFNITKKCVSTVADFCDITFGITDPGPWSLEYHTDTVAAMSQPETRYSPFDFLLPFSWEVWVVIAAVVFITTPLVMAIVEFDDGETIAGNFLRFLPDSIHAHTGADILSNDKPERNTSYVLSVFVAIFSFVVICLYSSNLTAYVLYKDDTHARNRYVVVDENVSFSVHNATPIPLQSLAKLIHSGITKNAIVVGENRWLRRMKTCADRVVPLDIPVSKWVDFANMENVFPEIERFTHRYDTVAKNPPEHCGEKQLPMTLDGIYGLFLMFSIPAALIITSTCLKYGYKRFKQDLKSGSTPVIN